MLMLMYTQYSNMYLALMYNSISIVFTLPSVATVNQMTNKQSVEENCKNVFIIIIMYIQMCSYFKPGTPDFLKSLLCRCWLVCAFVCLFIHLQAINNK